MYIARAYALLAALLFCAAGAAWNVGMQTDALLIGAIGVGFLTVAGVSLLD